jgi:hypothetical protein
LQARILQGYVDGNSGVKINKTEIIDLDPEKKDPRPELMTMVRWLLGKPIGNVK